MKEWINFLKINKKNSPLQYIKKCTPFLLALAAFLCCFLWWCQSLWLLLPLPLPPPPTLSQPSPPSAESVTNDLHVAKSNVSSPASPLRGISHRIRFCLWNCSWFLPPGSLDPSLLCRTFSSVWPLQEQVAEPGAWVPLSTSSRGESLKSCDLKVPSLCPGLRLYIAGRQGGPLPGPESGLLSNTRKWIVREDTRADRTRDSIGKGCLGGEKEGQGTQEDCSATWLTVSGFMVMGLVSRLSLANHCDSGSILVVHASLSQGGFQRGGFWEVGRTCDVSCWPFAYSSRWWWLVSSIFLTRTSCHKITQ